jgi:hypothetical protein
MSDSVIGVAPLPPWVKRSVRHVGGVEPAKRMLAQAQDLPIGERPRGAVGEVVHRHHGGDLAADRHRARGGGEELVQPAAFVRLVRDQVLVEAESRAIGILGRRVDAVDARGDLVEVGAAGCVGSGSTATRVKRCSQVTLLISNLR